MLEREVDDDAPRPTAGSRRPPDQEGRIERKLEGHVHRSDRHDPRTPLRRQPAGESIACRTRDPARRNGADADDDPGQAVYDRGSSPLQDAA
jgi:hypothetical protein